MSGILDFLIGGAILVGALLADDNNVKPPVKPPKPGDDASEDEADKEIKFHFGELRLICIADAQTKLLLTRAAAWQLQSLISFQRNDQLPYFTQVPDSLVQGVLHQLADDIGEIIEDKDETPKALKEAVNGVLDANDAQALVSASNSLADTTTKAWEVIFNLANTKFKEDKFGGKKRDDLTDEDMEKFLNKMQDLTTAMLSPRLSSSELNGLSKFELEFATTPDRLVFKWPSKKYGNDFLTALMKVAEEYREGALQFPHTAHDRLAFHAGYYLLSQGQSPFDPYQSRTLGTIGFRKDAQTYLSLTDPGQGHVFGTTVRSAWMKGAIVHVEHLERPAGTTVAQIESYRIPSILEFARVCLHTGYAAPNTCFVGRPLHDSGELKYDFIKVVDTVSSACSSIFRLGAAECKIAMGNLKASDMVAYMRALRAHTLKNYRQSFSAAFNLNTPLIDDIKGKYYTKPIKIARRAVKLAALGGFDKVTWDGASDSYPSVPLLKADENSPGLLSLRDALELVHRAHSAGLVTYFSAGFKPKHIKVAVYSGVDGIGLGGAQVLRSMDDKTKMHGEYQESRINELIRQRDEAEATIRGRAVRLLARLDQMYFEGSINEDEKYERDQLYQSLYQGASDDILEGKINGVIATEVFKIPVDFDRDGDDLVRVDNPWIGRAKRLLDNRRNKSSLLELHGGPNWESFKNTLQQIVDSKEHEDGSENTCAIEGNLHSLSMSQQWKGRRAEYRKWLANNDNERQNKGLAKASRLPKFVAGEIDVSIKATPFEKSQSLVIKDLFPKGESPN